MDYFSNINMNYKSIFFILCLIWYFSNFYGPRYNLFSIFRKIIQKIQKSSNSNQKFLYEDKFLEKFKNMPKKQESHWNSPQSNSCYVIEYTPLGNVLMSYNTTNNLFEYYSDDVIKPEYLKVVARKYVIQFNCKEYMETEVNEEVEKNKPPCEQKTIVSITYKYLGKIANVQF